jgi:hypothetical protein
MHRWRTPRPLALPVDFATVKRLDLEFGGVRRDAGSFTVFVFVGPEQPEPHAGRDHDAFAGAFTIFAPSFCWGAEGHCDWQRPPVSAFDYRPPHHLRPINVSIEITHAIERLGNPDGLDVTVHAARRGDRDATEGVFVFDHVRALAYQ